MHLINHQPFQPYILPSTRPYIHSFIRSNHPPVLSPIHPFIHLTTHLSIHPRHPFIHLSIHPPVHTPTHPSIHPFVNPCATVSHASECTPPCQRAKSSPTTFTYRKNTVNRHRLLVYHVIMADIKVSKWTLLFCQHRTDN